MWEIKSSRLISGLNLLDLVGEKVGLSSSEFFWVHGKKDKVTFSVASYIMGEVTFIGHGEWPKGDFFIDRRVFLPFVYASKAIKNKATFQFEVHKRKLIVRHGSRKAEFLSQKDVRGYGQLKKIMKEEESEIQISDDMKALLLCGKNCAVTDAVVPHLNCCYVSKGAVSMEVSAASDRIFFLGVGTDKSKKIKQSIPFPLFMIDMLNEPTLKKVSWRGKYIVCTFERGVIWQSISQEALDKFPLGDIHKLVKRATKMPIMFTTSSRWFSKLIVRLGYYLQAVRRRDWVVSLKGKQRKNSLQLSTKIPGVHFDESIRTSDRLPQDVDVVWPLDCLEPVFQFLSQKTKKHGLVVRMDQKRGISYVTSGQYWFAVTSKKED